MPRILYHGTATPYLPAILQDGLKPMPGNRWKARIAGMGHPPIDGSFVYVTPDEGYAEDFAVARAEYLKAKPNAVFMGGRDFCHSYLMKKDDDAPVIATAEPVLIRASLPQSWPVLPDPRSQGLITPRPIPPQYLTVVHIAKERTV